MITFEYNKDQRDGNENDKKYLEYCELLIEAKELGVGYWCDWEDTLHLVPTPITSLDDRVRFHSLENPAIYWKGGIELYYISGVSFNKDLWTKVVKDKLSAQEVFAIENTEQRRIAYEQMDKLKMKELKDYTVLDHRDKDEQGNKDEIVSFTVPGFNESFLYYHCEDPSTGRRYFLQTNKTKCIDAKAASFGLDQIEWSAEW